MSQTGLLKVMHLLDSGDSKHICKSKPGIRDPGWQHGGAMSSYPAGWMEEAQEEAISRKSLCEEVGSMHAFGA